MNKHVFLCLFIDFQDIIFALCMPGLLYQIFTILILIDDPMTHVVYALIPGKSQRIYIRFFTLLHDNFNDQTLAPSSFIADFETTVHNSIWEVFSCITTKGCFFSTLPKQYGVKYSWQDYIIHQRRRQCEDIGKKSYSSPLVPIDSIEEVLFWAIEDRGETDLTETFTY